MGFVEGVMANENLRSFLSEKMEEFKTMSYQSKMDILIRLLDEVYKDSEGPLKNDLLFLFGNKVMLIFSLLSHYLKQWKIFYLRNCSFKKKWHIYYIIRVQKTS